MDRPPQPVGGLALADQHRSASAAVLQFAPPLDRAVRRVARRGADTLRALLDSHRANILRGGAPAIGSASSGGSGRHSGGVAIPRAVRPGNSNVRPADVRGSVRPVLPGALADESGPASSRLGRPVGCPGPCHADPQLGCGLLAGGTERSDGDHLPTVPFRA